MAGLTILRFFVALRGWAAPPTQNDAEHGEAPGGLLEFCISPATIYIHSTLHPAPRTSHLPSPSAWRHRLIIIALAAVAFTISVVLALHQLGKIGPVWDPLFGRGTERVIDSYFSRKLQKDLGLPDAALGALAYLTEIIFAAAGSDRRWKTKPWLVALFGMNAAALGVASVGLVFIQARLVHAWCFLCLVSAAISLAIAFMSDREVSATLQYLRDVRRESKDRGAVRRAFFGR